MVFEISPQPHFCNPELHVTSASSSTVRLSNCHGNGHVSHSISTEQETAAISLSCTANPSVGDERSAQSGVINAQYVKKEDFNFFNNHAAGMAICLQQARNLSVLRYHIPKL